MKQPPTDYIPPSEAGTLAGLFRARLERRPEAVAYMQFDPSDGRWHDATWAEVGEEVGRWQAALLSEGLSPGDRVAIQLRNCIEWVVFEQAALGLGLVVVPLYVEDRAENIAYVLNHAGVRLLCIQDGTRLANLSAHLAGAELRRIVVMRGPLGPGADPRAIIRDQWLPEKHALLVTSELSPETLATLVYTSGTTGQPKGVMLSHANILENAHAALTLETFYPTDRFLSFLPLSHMLERTAGYYLPMMAGAVVAFARSVQQLGEDMQSVRPTVLISVPRVFERVHERVGRSVLEKPTPVRTLFDATVRLGWRCFLARQGGRTAPLAAAMWKLLDPVVARPVRERMGGRLRFAVSGGAALAPPVARFFIGLGVEILQGYGLTESGPVISVNLPSENRPEGVGRPLPGVEVRTGEDQELLARGPSIMLGYWRDPQATAAIIDAEGWLHTGDQAELSAGHIRIVGRVKDVLVLSNGEKVPPSDMEGALMLDPLVEHALVCGEGRPYIGVLVSVAPEPWAQFCATAGVAESHSGATLPKALRQALLQRLGKALHGFPGYAKIRRAAVSLDAWTVENGLLTPTLKLRRREVERRYADLIGEMFEEI